jgi:phosphatidylserine/phosphatidylglycerophosphate/cardiolipin synthase-like enzyme
MRNKIGVHAVSTGLLDDLRRGVVSGKIACPFSVHDLAFGGLGKAAGALQSLYDRDKASVLAILDFVLAERDHVATRELELVWTGPEAEGGQTRDSEIVLGDLFRRAERTVLVVGYSFSAGGEVLELLHEGMRDRGVQASVFFDLTQVMDRARGVPIEAYAERCVERFLTNVWAFGPPVPMLYIDTRMLDEDAWRDGTFPKYSLHAKCASIDGREALITSANFTGRGQRRNVELGVRIQEAALAKQVEAQFSRLVLSGAMKRVR